MSARWAFAGTENMGRPCKVSDLILEVQNGKTEGAVMDELVAQAYVNADPSPCHQPAALDIGSDSGIRIGVQKGNDEFVTYLNQVIAEMQSQEFAGQVRLRRTGAGRSGGLRHAGTEQARR